MYGAECLVGKLSDHAEFIVHEPLPVHFEQRQDEHGHLFCLELQSGLQQHQLRMYPRHPLLCHPFEMGLMVWV